jgi:3',5'-cyclic AMP phosphodiesterase CpdA
MREPLRLAHISDLHFSKVTYSPLQLFNKRWLGNLNLLLNRKKAHRTESLNALVPLFQSLGVHGVIVTGDLSTTSQKEEFATAASFLQEIERQGISVFTLPGNHDQYTRRAFKQQLFYQFFESQFPESAYNLKEHKLTATRLADRWWLIALDTAVATSLFSSRGYFSPKTEALLTQALSAIPPGDRVILANHFPFFQTDMPPKRLGRGNALKRLLTQFPNVAFYLHGHTHRHCIADLRASQLPIVLDSGSTSRADAGSWNLIELTQTGCAIQVFRWNGTAQWCAEKHVPLLW